MVYRITTYTEHYAMPVLLKIVMYVLVGYEKEFSVVCGAMPHLRCSLFYLVITQQHTHTHIK